MRFEVDFALETQKFFISNPEQINKIIDEEIEKFG